MMNLDEAIQHCYGRARADCSECAEEHLQLAEWLEELKQYKGLEEQGKLLKLPCAVGNTVYVLCIDNLTYMITKEKIWEIIEEKFKIQHFDGIGKTVFLTREEAEAALKEL